MEIVLFIQELIGAVFLAIVRQCQIFNKIALQKQF